MNVLMHDIRFAIRSLRRNPAYTLTALITLVIGIGVNVAVFSVVRGVLLAPLPFPDPDHLYSVTEVNGLGNRMSVAWRNFVDWRDRQTAFESMAAWSSGGPATVLGLGQPVRVRASTISEGFFRTLGVTAVRGRALRPEEHEYGGRPAVVVSDAFWRAWLGSDPSFDERVIEVGGFQSQIVGVMPPGFDFPAGTDIWLAVELNEQSESRTAHNYNVVGRLGEGVDIAVAESNLDAITATFLTEDPGAANEDWFEDFFPHAASTEPLLESIVGDTRRPLLVLFGASFLVLLVACTNLASAMLARGTKRRHEYALRRSLGAGRSQLVRHVLTESVVLSTVGAALGVALAALAIRLLPALAPEGIPRLDRIALDGSVLGVAVILAVVTALLFGFLPATRVSEGDYSATLRSGRGGDSRSRVWNTLIAVEVALALMLLVGSGLLLRSFRSILDVQPGFATDGVLTATLNPPPSRYPDGESRRRFYDDVMREVGTAPNIAAAGLIATPPMLGVSNGRIDVRESPVTGITADYQVTSTGYFAALGIPLQSGRLFDERDGPGAPHAVVVNAAFAESAWPDEDPIGKQVTGGGMDDYWDQDVWATVVGVVGDIRQRDLTIDPRPTLYFSYTQRPYRTWTMTLITRPSRGTTAALGPVLRDAVRRIDSDVPVTLSTIESRISSSLTPRRFTMVVLGFFAVAALLLACVGIHGVVAYAVARRTREIGIRMALGANALSVRRLVQTGFLRATALGAVIGLLLSIALTGLLRSLLYGIEPTDPLTLAAVVATLGGAAWLASFLPARRTAKVSPMETMRSE